MVASPRGAITWNFFRQIECYFDTASGAFIRRKFLITEDTFRRKYRASHVWNSVHQVFIGLLLVQKPSLLPDRSCRACHLLWKKTGGPDFYFHTWFVNVRTTSVQGGKSGALLHSFSPPMFMCWENKPLGKSAKTLAQHHCTEEKKTTLIEVCLHLGETSTIHFVTNLSLYNLHLGRRMYGANCLPNAIRVFHCFC